MPRYEFEFFRTYTMPEGFTRIIEAPSEAEALAAASNLCSEFNEDCPDDCSELERRQTDGCGPFEAELVDAVHPTGTTDYRVGADGQVLPCED